MVVGNHQCSAANLNQSKPWFQLELSLAQFSPNLIIYLLPPQYFGTTFCQFHHEPHNSKFEEQALSPTKNQGNGLHHL